MGLEHQSGQGGGRPGSVWGWRSKGSLDSGWFPHSASCSRDLAAGAIQGPVGQRAEASASSLPWAPGGACPGPSAPGCCFCFAPSAFFSLLLVPPCLSPRPPAPTPPVLTLIQSSSPAGPQTPPPLSGQAEQDPRLTRVRHPRPLHPLQCTRAFEPLPPFPRPTSGRSARFPGCKSLPTAPWHLLGFQLQESLSWWWGGCAQGGGGSAGPSLCPAALGRGTWAMSSEILLSKSWAGCGF